MAELDGESASAGDWDEGLLPESDVRELVRLVASCAVAPGGIMGQKRHLMQGIAVMLGADYWMWNVARITDSDAIVAVSLLHNLSERQLAFLADDNYSAPDAPWNRSMVALSRNHPSWSRRLEDMLDIDADPERLYTLKTEIDISQSLFAFHEVPETPDMISGVGLHRASGKKPFDRRELRLLHIVMGEVGWLHEAGVPGEDGQVASMLSPRLQTVLTLLIDGLSAKRIAFNLGLSHHTVRGYIKDIYLHFDVGSRSELMRRFMVGDGSDSAS